MISNQAYIHPDAKLGKNVTVEPFAYIAGDVVIGDDCWIGPGAVIHDGARIGKGCKIHTAASIACTPQDLKCVGEKTTAEIGDYNEIREYVTISRGTASRTIRSTEPSSSLTAMRMAWKVRLAGCCFSRRAAGGMAPLTTSTSSSVVSMGRLSLARTMAPATAGAYRSSPYCQRMRRSSFWGHSLTTARAVRVSV